MPDNQQLLGELYGLRAGLSVISQNNDTVKKNERLIAESGTTMDSSASRIDEERKDIADRKNNIPRLQKRASEILQEIDKWKRDEKNRYYERVNTVTNHNPPKDIFVYSIYFPAIPILAIVYFVKRAKLKKKIHKLYDAEDARHLQEMQNSYKNTLAEIEREKQTVAQKIANESVKMKIDEYEKTKKTENDKIATYRLDINKIVADSKNIDKALVEKYSTMLNQSDWKHLDLVIYYLETGRAETIKEALQLTDRQLQTDQITNAITQACERICQTISSCTAALGRTMIECFNSLSMQIELEGNATRNAINQSTSVIADAISAQTAANAASNAETASRLEKALKIKSTVPSHVLVTDLETQRRHTLDIY